MERLGLQRAAGFTWKKSARATLDVYKEVVNQHSGSSKKRTHSAVPAVSRKR
jgi:hypothetical protein